MTLIYLARNDTDHTITVAIDNVRYEYYLPNSLSCDNVEYMMKRWPWKGLALLKKLNTRTEKLQ